MTSQTFIQPHWPAPPHIKAYSTLRSSNVSDTDNKKINTDRLVQLLHLPQKPIRIQQTHSTIALPAHRDNQGKEADAIFTHEPNQVCLVATADCLPVLLTDRTGTTVAAIHAGWRGLANGIMTETFSKLNLSGENTLAWLGPAISQPCYEVGDEVRDTFLAKDPATVHAFDPSPQGRWQADLYAIARLELKNLGISAIYGGEYCTFSNENFFSYRRDGKILGHIATLIWITSDLKPR